MQDDDYNPCDIEALEILRPASDYLLQMAAFGQIDLNNLARLEFRARRRFEAAQRIAAITSTPKSRQAPMSEDKAKRIAALNDLFRLNFFVPSFGPRPVRGHIVCTRGISALPPETQIGIWAEVSNFMTSRKTMIRTANVISERSTCRACPKRFSGRSTITRTSPARSALKTLPTRPDASACSPSFLPRNINHGPRPKPR